MNSGEISKGKVCFTGKYIIGYGLKNLSSKPYPHRSVISIILTIKNAIILESQDKFIKIKDKLLKEKILLQMLLTIMLEYNKYFKKFPIIA